MTAPTCKPRLQVHPIATESRHGSRHPLANHVPERFELVPWEAVRIVAATLTKGLEDHDEDGWRKLPRREHVGRALRHLALYLVSGDEEELRHGACRALMALETL